VTLKQNVQLSFPLFKLMVAEFLGHIHYICEAFILLSLGFEIIMHFEVLRFISTFISVIGNPPKQSFYHLFKLNLLRKYKIQLSGFLFLYKSSRFLEVI